MKSYAQAFLLAFCAMLMAPAQAEEVDFSLKFAGTVYDVPALQPGDTMIITEANASGSFGAQHILVISQFTPFLPAAACVEGEIPMVMGFARSVTTYKNHDQMFVFWDSGWICATPGPAGLSSYRGEVIGHIVSGTGRFEGATGTVTSEFGGFDLSGPFVFEGPLFPIMGSFAGTVYGTVVFAD